MARCRLQGWAIRAEVDTQVATRPRMAALLDGLYLTPEDAEYALARLRPQLAHGDSAVVVEIAGELREKEPA